MGIKIRQSSLGKPKTEQHRLAISQAMKGKCPILSEQERRNRSVRMKIVTKSERWKEAMRVYWAGRSFTPVTLSLETRARISASIKRSWRDPEHCQTRMVARALRPSPSLETRDRISASIKRLWQDPEYRQSMITALTGRKMPEQHCQYARERAFRNFHKWKCPTKLEIRLEKLLSEWFPNQWQYVGCGKLRIGNRCPDYRLVDQNKLIELNSNYWHGIFDPARQIYDYAQCGFQCLPIWEDELQNEHALKQKVEGFIHV